MKHSFFSQFDNQKNCLFGVVQLTMFMHWLFHSHILSYRSWSIATMVDIDCGDCFGNCDACCDCDCDACCDCDNCCQCDCCDDSHANCPTCLWCWVWHDAGTSSGHHTEPRSQYIAERQDNTQQRSKKEEEQNGAVVTQPFGTGEVEGHSAVTLQPTATTGAAGLSSTAPALEEPPPSYDEAIGQMDKGKSPWWKSVLVYVDSNTKRITFQDKNSLSVNATLLKFANDDAIGQMDKHKW